MNLRNRSRIRRNVVQTIKCHFCHKSQLANQPGCQFCDSPAAPAAGEGPIAAAIQEVEEVTLDSLRAKDYLIMHTENSVYRLTMIEPAARRGLLSGGKLGAPGVEVILVATTPP